MGTCTEWTSSVQEPLPALVLFAVQRSVLHIASPARKESSASFSGMGISAELHTCRSLRHLQVGLCHI